MIDLLKPPIDLFSVTEAEKLRIHALVISWLEELGSSRRKVTRSLRKLGVNGVPRNSTVCPIAVLVRDNLRKAVDYPVIVVVGVHSGNVFLSNFHGTVGSFGFVMPKPVIEFIAWFDSKDW